MASLYVHPTPYTVTPGIYATSDGETHLPLFCVRRSVSVCGMGSPKNNSEVGLALGMTIAMYCDTIIVKTRWSLFKLKKMCLVAVLIEERLDAL